ncbi:MAG: BON domain-containing protein [Ardenticatenales bacterium]
MAAVILPTHMIEHPTEQLVRGLDTAVEGALWSYQPIRQSNCTIDILVDGNTVTLDGNIRGSLLKAMAGEIASRVPGVGRVVNRLVSDTDIEHEAAVQLTMDDGLDLTTDHITVKSLMGTVYLGGMIFADTLTEAEALKAQAEALIGNVAGVRGVVSSVTAVEGSPDSFAAPADSGPVLAAAPKIEAPRGMGTLIPEDRKNKIRTMIAARAQARAAREG